MIANKYTIEKEIQRGVFGIILKGIYNKKNEPVAIKIEHGSINSLKHEVKMCNYLYMSGVRKIPNIYWFGTYMEKPCLVMTFYECSLYTYLHQFSFNMPPSGAEMNELDRLLCASSMRKGVKFTPLKIYIVGRIQASR